MYIHTLDRFLYQITEMAGKMKRNLVLRLAHLVGVVFMLFIVTHISAAKQTIHWADLNMYASQHTCL